MKYLKNLFLKHPKTIINVKKFKKNFPQDLGEIPPELLSMAKKDYSSGDFQLYDSYWKSGWEIYFPEKETSHYFIPFGFDADGSIYAFWRYKESPMDTLPVVFLGFSWTGTTIVADNIRDFMALLSLGIQALGYDISFPGWEKQISNTPEIMQFRNWLKREFDISMPENPLALVEKARNSHPGLGMWIEEKTGIPPESFTENKFFKN